MAETAAPRRYLALCGGVGGAKLALGLSRVLPPEALTIVVNTGDDFEHLGLLICPDIDTVTYTLGDVVHPGQGWGRADEHWAALAEIERLGGESWFRLGDKDLGLHLVRRSLLETGLTLSEVTARLSRSLGVQATVAPMSDAPVRTLVESDQGVLAFQHYFVRERCSPRVKGLQYSGAGFAAPSPALSQALADPALAGVFICPSNPYLSIDPILAVSGVRDALCRLDAPVVAVAPIVSGLAIKGPTAKIMAELGIAPTAVSVAEHYRDFLDGYVIDSGDAALADHFHTGVSLHICPTVMTTLDDKMALAQACIDFAHRLAGQP